MSTILSILMIAFSVVTPAADAQAARPALLPDGFILTGIEGKLTGSDSNDVWLFELGSDIADDDIVLKAQTSLKLLPSATLEKLVTDANERSANSYMLWGRITKYKGKNFIFPSYFSPLIAPPTPTIPSQKEPAETIPSDVNNQKPAVNDPNDLLTIPQEVLEKLKAARSTTPASMQRPRDNKAIQNQKMRPSTEEISSINTKLYTQNIDSVFIDRTALLLRLNEDQLLFLLDALGRNMPEASLQLLPCEMLELTEQRQSAVPEPVRFKIAGIMTKYKGQSYLLLQKATRIYSHGNFGR